MPAAARSRPAPPPPERARPDPAPAVRALEAEVATCRACAADFAATATRHRPAPISRLSSTARLLVASQAPGARAHASGLYFDDASGDRLRAWMGLDRATFYDRRRVAILPMAFCFPGYDSAGSDLAPPRRCAALWRDRALALMPQVETTLIVGGHAQAWTLGDRRSVAARVRDWRARAPEFVPLPHPSWRNTAWLKKHPEFEAEVLPWLRARVAELVA